MTYEQFICRVGCFKSKVLCTDVLQEPQNQSLSAERHSHTVALQVLERQAKEDVLSERNRLQTMLQLELGNTHKYIRTHTCMETHTFALNIRTNSDGNACFKTHMFLH